MAQKISVIIPNYNGKELLSKNLPIVIENCPNCEIIIVDDASTDDSLNFLQKNFKKIKLVIHDKNEGFAKSVNDGVNRASGELIVLLNSDVSPRPNFLKDALSHFMVDTELFAVGFADYSHEGDKIVIRGRGGVNFKKGFVAHFAVTPKAGETFWISGGSGLFSKKKFLELGGFDTNFAPFYWEDIDLAFRAWQKGYRCLFEPNAKVDHFHHEGAIKKSKSPFFIKSVSYKNQFIFVWKNISDVFFLIAHLLWLPYHFAKAAITFDVAFFAGFAWAIFQLPKLIFDYPVINGKFVLSDKEIIQKFARS